VNKSPVRILPGSRLTLATLLFALIVGAPAFILVKAPLFAQAAPPTPPAQENRKTKFVIQPEYPELAKKNNISGTARVQALIAADGTVKEVKILGGSPVLVQAVVDAVKKWKYEPASTSTTAVLKFDFKAGQ
jgi:TonB family protein